MRWLLPADAQHEKWMVHGAVLRRVVGLISIVSAGTDQLFCAIHAQRVEHYVERNAAQVRGLREILVVLDGGGNLRQAAQILVTNKPLLAWRNARNVPGDLKVDGLAANSAPGVTSSKASAHGVELGVRRPAD